MQYRLLPKGWQQRHQQRQVRGTYVVIEKKWLLRQVPAIAIVITSEAIE